MGVTSTIAELTSWAEPALAGWRYLLSPTYRARKHHDWRMEHLGYVVLDVIGGTIGVGVTVALATFLVAVSWRAIAT